MCWRIAITVSAAAHNAGMHPIMVPDILQPDDEIRSLCEAVAASLDEAKDYLDHVING